MLKLWKICISSPHLVVVLADLNAAESDPLSRVGPAEPGGGAGPGQGRLEPAAAGGGPAGAESGRRQDPAGDHHQVPEGHAG